MPVLITSKKKLHVDSFSLHPILSRDSVIATSPYQTDYLTLTTGAVNAMGFNLDSFNKNKAVIADSISINRPVIYVYRDKLPPSPPAAIKPLPTATISKITWPVDINKIIIDNGEVSYTEKNEKSRMEGTLLLARMNGTIGTIKNNRIAINDSLNVNVHMLLMNEAPVHIIIKEAYKDSANGFTLKLQMEPTKLSVLNPIMVPLSNVKITAGTVDTFNLEAVAREYFAVGNIKMYYKNLHIKIINDGNPNKSSFKNKILTFLVNTFVINNNNSNKTGIIFLERMRERSFFNYLLKIAFNGIGSSVRTRMNKKNKKLFKKELEERKLSPNFQEQYIPD